MFVKQEISRYISKKIKWSSGKKLQHFTCKKALKALILLGFLAFLNVQNSFLFLKK